MKTKNKTNKVGNVSFTFGSDLEVHIFDKNQGRVVSSLDVLKGHDKYDKISLGDGCECYADNVLIENSFPPVETKEEFLNKFKYVLGGMQRVLGENYALLPKAAVMYDNDQMLNPKALEIGCSPNFDVYRETINMPEPFKSNLRTGSFHIHLGNKDWKKAKNNQKLLTVQSKNDTIKLMDIFVGVSSVIFDKDETSVIRRQIYGKSGEFRPTPYGAEYRVLGNYAILSPELTGLVFDLTQYALSYIKNGNESDILGKINSEQVIECINTGNKELAKSILIEASLPEDLMGRVYKDYDVANFEKNWGITS